MVGLYTGRIETNEALAREGVDAIPATTGEVLRAQGAQAINDLGFWRQGRINERDIENQESRFGIGLRGTFSQTGDVTEVEPRSRVLSPEEANETFGLDGKLTFDAPVSENFAQEMARLKREEMTRQDVFRRAQGGAAEWTGRIGIGLAASILDPLNVASAFIPVVGPTRYAMWLRGASGLGQRTAIRSGVGALEGAVGAAAIEPIMIGQASAEQADYTMADSLLNIAFGTVLGGGLHAAAGAIGERISGGFARQVENLPIEEKEAALRSAVAALGEGRPVDVGMFFLRQELLSGTALGRRADVLTPERLAGLGGEDAPAIAPPRVMVPVAERDRGYERFANAEDAGRAAARIERRTGEAVEVRQSPDGAFYLAREIPAEPVRGADGQALTFQTERAALRYAEQQMKGEDVAAVAAGPAGERAFVLLRGATERDVRAIKAEPALVELGRAEDRSFEGVRRAEAAKIAETRRQARADLDRKVQEIVRQEVAGYADPRDVAAAAAIDRLARRAAGASRAADDIQWTDDAATPVAQTARSPVVAIQGDEIAPRETDLPTLRQRAREWYEKNLRGTKVRSEALDADVEFRSSRKAFSAAANPEKIRLFAVLREIVARGELVESVPPRVAGTSTKAYHFIDAMVDTPEGPRRVGVTIREDAAGRLYYNHALIDEGRPAPVARQDTAGKAGPPDTTGGGTARPDNLGPDADEINLTAEPAQAADKAAKSVVKSKAVAEAQALLDAELQRLDPALREEGAGELTEADQIIERADAAGRAYRAGAACMAGRIE